MTGYALTTIFTTLMVGWLMVMAGLGKRKLERRPRVCPTCGRRRCVCAVRRF
ncbi:MAG TPA: hypothetical protein VJ986_01985 [Gaiellaceae bacterium]|nr:hypothetical protein [Gaiellaceae bacterium]